MHGISKIYKAMITTKQHLPLTLNKASNHTPPITTSCAAILVRYFRYTKLTIIIIAVITHDHYI